MEAIKEKSSVKVIQQLFILKQMIKNISNSEDLISEFNNSYLYIKELFKEVFDHEDNERREIILSLKDLFKIIYFKSKQLDVVLDYKELYSISKIINNSDLNELEQNIWYQFYRKNIYSIKIFDTEWNGNEVTFKCAWYASLYKESDAEIIRRTKIYLYNKKTEEKVPLYIRWGESTYYKYDFPHERFINPYDNFRLTIDLEVLTKGEYEIFYEIFGLQGKVRISNAAVTRKLTKKSIRKEKYYEEVYFRISSRVIYINIYKREYHVKNLIKSKLKGILYDIHLISRLDKNRKLLYFIYIFNNLLKRLLRKDIILMGELPNAYEDSASVLFNELKKEKREFRYYYVTTRESLLKEDRRYIKFGSVRHKILFILADIVANVQNIDLYMNPYMIRNEKFVAKRDCKDTLLFLAFSKYLYNQKRIFIQHGVLYQSGLTDAIYINSDFDYLVVSTEFEEKIFPSDARIFIENCLPRFSTYKNKSTNKKILFSPTWRKYLKDANSTEIRNSEYFRNINNFLCSKELDRILKKYNYTLVYNIHHSIRDIMIKELSAAKLSKNIELVQDNTELNKLICECDICITDYSSLFFDFLWQGKPVIHYIYDYYDFHYRKDNNKKVNDNFDLLNYNSRLVANNLKELMYILEREIRNDKESHIDNIFFSVSDPCEKMIEEIRKIFRSKGEIEYDRNKFEKGKYIGENIG